jgi:hypothetical protein
MENAQDVRHCIKTPTLRILDFIYAYVWKVYKISTDPYIVHLFYKSVNLRRCDAAYQ